MAASCNRKSESSSDLTVQLYVTSQVSRVWCLDTLLPWPSRPPACAHRMVVRTTSSPSKFLSFHPSHLAMAPKTPPLILIPDFDMNLSPSYSPDPPSHESVRQYLSDSSIIKLKAANLFPTTTTNETIHLPATSNSIHPFQAARPPPI